MHPSRKLGRMPRMRKNIPHFSQMRRAIRADIPAEKTWLAALPADLGVMLNDRLGCCTISGLHHARQVWTANAGRLVTDSDAAVISDYEALCGYRLDDPDSDKGGYLQAVLSGAVCRGITTENGPDKLLGFVEVDPRNQRDIREIIALGGCAYIGLNMPEAWTNATAGGLWDATNSPTIGGHCVILAGYDPNGFDVISWGERFRLTNYGFSQCCDEVYWPADSAWIERTGQTPGGLTQNEISDAMRSVQAAA